MMGTAVHFDKIIEIWVEEDASSTAVSIQLTKWQNPFKNFDEADIVNNK